MPINLVKIAALQARVAAGETLAVCEYLRVDWSEAVTSYYGSLPWHEVPPFHNIGLLVEGRIKSKGARDPFHDLEICPDLRTDSVKVTFNDVDKEITGKFQDYNSGVNCEFILYYPAEDYHHPLWFGQLQAPQVYGWKTVEAVATNGYRSRELIVPGRNHRAECGAAVFSGKFQDTDSVRSSICPYDKHLGGTVGKNNPATGQPYLDCPKTYAACVRRLDMNNDGVPEYFPGFRTDTVPIPAPYQGIPFLFNSKGNASNLTEPVRVIAGFKVLHNPHLILSAMTSPPHIEDAWVKLLFDCGEGPIAFMGSIFINNAVDPWPEAHIQRRLGTRGQPRTNFADNVANYSGTAHVYFNYGGPKIGILSDNWSPSDFSASVQIDGFNQVTHYTDPVTKTYAGSLDRVFWLLEFYKNQKFGLGYAEDLIELQDWIDVADWGATDISHTILTIDGEEQTYAHRRTSFNAIVDGRPVGELVDDICRSGGIFQPFQYQGKYTIAAARAATEDELTNAKVFTDTGENVNICWDGQPMISLSQTPDNKVVNEIELRFEESARGDVERPLTVDDPNQKLLAGRQLGPDQYLSVPKKYTGFGISYFAEAVHIAYRLLKYGEHDSGGTDNNIKVTLTVPFEHVLELRRYDIIKVVSELLDQFDLPSGVVDDTDRYPVEYFRILQMKKVSGGRCEITAQVYNHTSYTNFETEIGGGGGTPNALTVMGGGVAGVNGSYVYLGISNGKPSYSHDNTIIEWRVSPGTPKWIMWDGESIVWYTAPAGDYPWDGVWSSTNGAYNPAPTVVEGIPPVPRSAPVTITASYNPADGVIEVQT